jgi:hypothetical protein
MDDLIPNLDGINLDAIHDAPLIQSQFKPKETKPKKKKVSTKKSPACKKLNETLQAKGLKGELHENSASQIERCIIAYIKLITKCTAWKVGVKGTPRKIKGKMVMTNSGDTVGVADVHALINGRYLAVEVKFSKGDKQSPAQVRWEKRVIDSGGSYIIVRNFTDFIPKFKAWYSGEQLNLFQ